MGFQSLDKFVFVLVTLKDLLILNYETHYSLNKVQAAE